jgi:hypothetical protein
MKLLKVLGSEKVYLFEDGEKVPFGDRKRFNEKRKQVETVSIDEAVEVLEKPKKKKKRGKK